MSGGIRLEPGGGAPFATGASRLDDVLDGGLSPGRNVLYYGPKFVGKETLALLGAVEALEQGRPVIQIVTNNTAEERIAALQEAGADTDAAMTAGRLRFIDCYSRSVDADEDVEAATYTDGPMDLNGLSNAIGEAQRGLVKAADSHLLVFDSLSTLIAFSNAQTVFRFMQVLLGRSKRASAASIVMMDEGMHPDADVQSFKHLMDGVISFREDGGKMQLQLLGLGITRNPGWVEYVFTETGFELTGSLAAGRIR